MIMYKLKGSNSSIPMIFIMFPAFIGYPPSWKSLPLFLLVFTHSSIYIDADLSFMDLKYELKFLNYFSDSKFWKSFFSL